MNREIGKFAIETTHNFMRSPALRFGFRVTYQYKIDDYCRLFESATVFEDESKALEAGERWLLRLITAGEATKQEIVK